MAGTPYRLIATDDPDRTFGEGHMRYFPTMLDAANAFVKASEPYKTIVYDDGCVARELDDREQRLLERVCELLGYEMGEVGA
jgi:hypothetical protein